MKTLACKDMGMDCPWVGHAETVDELVVQSKTHAQESHKEYWDETMSKMNDEEIKKNMEQYVKEA